MRDLYLEVLAVLYVEHLDGGLLLGYRARYFACSFAFRSGAFLGGPEVGVGL